MIVDVLNRLPGPGTPDGVRPLFAEVGAAPTAGNCVLPPGSIVRFGTAYYFQKGTLTAPVWAEISGAIGYGAGVGLTVNGANLDVNLSTGKAGGQTITGGVAAGENLTLRSTSHGTKGAVKIGDIAPDNSFGLDISDSILGSFLWGNGTTRKGFLSYGGTGISLAAVGAYPLQLYSNTFECMRLDATSGRKIGVYTKTATPAVQPTSGADLTNSVASGGTDDTVGNWTDLTTYATDAAAIRNAVYQLARKLKQINDGLRTIGWFT